MTGRGVKGWCPSVSRPMESGDGLVVRLKICGGIVDARLALEIADWSQAWGNGRIDLSGRANLQLRGMSEASVLLLQDALADWGLAENDPDAEAVRNIVSSPLAGLDPDALLDVRPIVRDLDRRLACDPKLRGLPGKFGFAIDDGGAFGLDDVPADIRFRAARTADGPGFEVDLASATNERFGPCSPAAVADLATALGLAFLELRKGREAGIRRMRDLAAEYGVEFIADRVGLARIGAPSRASGPSMSSACLGAKPLGAAAIVGLGLPFGGIAAADFSAIAEAAIAHGAQELRLTPWRALLVSTPSLAAAQALSTAPAARSFIVDPDDPRRGVVACIGAPSCARGAARARDDAGIVAASLACVPRPGIVVHVSGCDKGCAHPRSAPITFVGRNGRYDLIRDGAPWDLPVLERLTLDEAVAAARRIVAGLVEGKAA